MDDSPAHTEKLSNNLKINSLSFVTRAFTLHILTAEQLLQVVIQITTKTINNYVKSGACQIIGVVMWHDVCYLSGFFNYPGIYLELFIVGSWHK